MAGIEARLRKYDAWLRLEYQDRDARVYSVRDSAAQPIADFQGPSLRATPDRRKPMNSAAQAPNMIAMISG